MCANTRPLHLRIGEVHDKSNGKPDHEGGIQLNLRKAKQCDDTDREQEIEPEEFRALERRRFLRGDLLRGRGVLIELRRLARRHGARAAPFFQNAHKGGEDEHHADADDLQWDQRVPECIDVRIEDHSDACDGTAPRQEVHDTHRRADDDAEDYRTDMQPFVDWQHRGDRHEQRCGERAVEMGDRGDARRRHRDENDVRSRVFYEEVDERIEQPDLRHDGEIDDGEDKEHGDRHGRRYAALDELCNLRKIKAADNGADDRHDDKYRRWMRLRLQQAVDD